jgi:sec-independent protein translocase protein TatA
MLLEPQNFVLLGFMGIGPQELIIVAIIVLILFGSRLPSVMRNLGRGVTEFKKGVSGVDDDEEDVVIEGKKKQDA